MSNKTKLQQHNADLATALDNINGLPIADDVAKQAMHGKHVWSVHTLTNTKTFRKPDFTINGNSSRVKIGDVYKIYGLDEIIDYITPSFFNGYYYYDYDDSVDLIVSGEEITFNNVSSYIKFKFDKANRSLVVIELTYDGSWRQLSFKSDGSTTTVVAEEDVFVDKFKNYVVSDNASEFPDGAIKNGYMYTKINSEMQYLWDALGVRKSYKGTFTFSTPNINNSNELMISTGFSAIIAMYIYTDVISDYTGSYSYLQSEFLLKTIGYNSTGQLKGKYQFVTETKSINGYRANSDSNVVYEINGGSITLRDGRYSCLFRPGNIYRYVILGY